MKITPMQTEKLLSGKQMFSLLGFSMLVTRLKTRYIQDPSSTSVQSCTEEINTFLKKFDSIMSADYELIKKL